VGKTTETQETDMTHIPRTRHLTRRKSILIAATALAASLALANGARAADPAWPDRPLHIIVPYSAGGAVDTLARLTGKALSSRLGQSVIVENKPGGGSNIGLEAAAKAASNGYTLLMSSNSLATNNHLYSKLPFNALKDFAAVAQIGYAPLIIAVPATSPDSTLKALLERARAHAGKLNFASSGNGSSSHIAGEALKQLAGVDIVHIPYKGAAPAMTDLISGRTAFMLVNTADSLSFFQSGKLRALAVAGTQRLKLLPDVPTAAQAGLPGYQESVWWGLTVPAKTPKHIIDKLNAVVQGALHDTAFTGHLTQLGVIPAPGTPGQFESFIRNESARTEKVIKTAHITLD